MKNILYNSNRYLFIDTLRGAALVNMIAYHLCWNLVYILGISIPWYHSTGARLWQIYICVSFLVLSGLCIRFSKKIWRHITILASCSAVITIVTRFIDHNMLIVFGILHCMTACFIIFVLFRRFFEQAPYKKAVIICILLFIITYNLPRGYLGFKELAIQLPDKWYQFYHLSILGFRSPEFHSADYFPLIPYFFIFMAGYYLSKFDFPTWMKQIHFTPLTILGQHSLAVYLVHQPILYALMFILI